MTNTWDKISELASRHQGRSPESYIADDEWHNGASHGLEGLLLDWSLQRIDAPALETLIELANERRVLERLRDQFAGLKVNETERRAALHTALRGTSTGNAILDKSYHDATSELFEFGENVLTGQFTGFAGDPFSDVVHLGIGGSHLCQSFLSDALSCTHLSFHFLSSPDRLERERCLAQLDPSRTLVIVASKSFTTPETQKQFTQIKQWFAEHTTDSSNWSKNTVIITSNDHAISDLDCKKFIVPIEIGGRYSVWSAMGLPVLLAAGLGRFRDLLDGAQWMDEHVRNSKAECNAAILLAMFAVWNTNGLGVASHVVLPYHPVLDGLQDHLRQLEMESLGKSHTELVEQCAKHTLPVVWGGRETDGQHAWHQWLHQGSHPFSADFIAVANTKDEDDRWMLANCLAQQQLMFLGHRDDDAPYKSVPGGHGSSLILLDQANAYNLGKLIALYEHKVACLGYLWGVNPFDQWGVEQGKTMASQAELALVSNPPNSGSKLLDDRVLKIASHEKKHSST